jgi:hypothetical protein
MIKSKYNKLLEKFKNLHNGDTAIIFATGPSLKNYVPLDNSEKYIKIGLNKIYDYPDILCKLNYYYYGSHYYLDGEHRKNIEKVCMNKNITTFASAYEDGISHKDINRGNITPERAIELNSIPFENTLHTFTNDVENYCSLGHSIIFPPLQHILYMGIKKIYFVGCDGGFTQGKSSSDNHLLFWWKKFVEFKNIYYPEVKIISVNPVSLKGWFDEDIYT